MIKWGILVLRRFIVSLRQDWSSFLLALFLALVVWVIAIQQQDPLITQRLNDTVTIQYVDLPAGMVIFGTPPENLQLSIRGPRSVVEGLTGSSFSAKVELAGLQPGIHDLPVQVMKSPSVDIVSQKPERVTIHLERLAHKKMPVEVIIADQPPAGYSVYPERATIQPMTVTISGPESQVKQVTRVVAQLYVSSAKQTFSRKTLVDAWDANNQTVFDVTAEPRVVNVTLPVEQQPGYLDLPVVVQTRGKPAEGYWLQNVSVEPAVVTLKGSPAALKSLPGYVETAVLDLTGADKDIVERLALVLPRNVSVVNSKSVKVEVKIMPIEGGKTIERVPQVQGLNEGLALRAPLNPITIVLSGPLPKLSKLGAAEVSVVVDFSNITAPGVYTIKPVVVVPQGVTVQSVVPSEINVEVIALLPTVTPSPTVSATPAITVTSTITPTTTTASP